MALTFEQKGFNTRHKQAFKANVDDPELVDRSVCITNSKTNPVPVLIEKDATASSTAFSGTATTVVQNVPAVADKVILSAIIYADSKNLQVSFDSGATFFTFLRRGALVKDVKGDQTQIQIQTTTGSVDFEIILDFEGT